ncbi:MAG: carbohydrate ABC transporter permease [Hamadaea sp.]|nr:carbohydrate ABC transporter permease [Hamadaea sp.]
MSLLRRRGSLTALVIATVLVLIPFWWMLSIAFKPESEVFTPTPQLLPGDPTLDNFTTALDDGNLGRAMVNSLLVALLVVVANCILALLAGYAFAKLPFRGSNAAFMLIVSTTMVPIAVTLIPLFLVTKGIPLAGGNDIFGQGGAGLLDSLGGLALPHLIGPLNIFLARQFFLGLDDEIGEAGRIDGASELTLFWRIYLPLAKPLVATVAVFAFTSVWDDFLWPLVITTSPETQTVQLALSQFLTGGNVAFGPAMAGSVLVILPILAVFLFNQRSFVAGLSEGGVKG